MWTANAATVAPSADTRDHRVHFTPANLTEKLHRSIEHVTTAKILEAIFHDDSHFAHHAPLPASNAMGDEGAANHTRLCGAFDRPGVQLFVYGRSSKPAEEAPREFPARQTEDASRSIARLHLLDPSRVVFARQSAAAIDAGVFHNDVISVGHQNVLLHHEDAFASTEQTLAALKRAAETTLDRPLITIAVRRNEVSIEDAITSYLFNSQLVTRPDQSLALIAPMDVANNPRTRAFVDRLITEDNPIREVCYFDLRESMQNGGGPACLRLRVVLTEEEIAHTKATVFYDRALHERLVAWVEKFYRDALDPADLADPLLIEENRRALDELTQILDLGSIYEFQR